MSQIKEHKAQGFKNILFSKSNIKKNKQNQPDVQKTTNNKTSQKNQKTNTNQRTKKKSVQKPKQQNANSEEENSDIEQMSRVPYAKEEEKLNSNPLEIVLINGNITKCLGCKFQIPGQ